MTDNQIKIESIRASFPIWEAKLENSIKSNNFSAARRMLKNFYSADCLGFDGHIEPTREAKNAYLRALQDLSSYEGVVHQRVPLGRVLSIQSRAICSGLRYINFIRLTF